MTHEDGVVGKGVAVKQGIVPDAHRGVEVREAVVQRLDEWGVMGERDVGPLVEQHLETHPRRR